MCPQACGYLSVLRSAAPVDRLTMDYTPTTPTGLEHTADAPLLFPEFSSRDRRLFQAAVQRLQAHSAITALDPDDETAQEIFHWADHHIAYLQEWFRAAGVGVRRHEGFDIIQLALEGDAGGHPLRRRLDKAQTGLLVCLWLLYHERAAETTGFRILVSVEEIYQRLGALFRDDRRWPETPFRDALKFLEKHSLVETNLDEGEFPQGEVALLPTLLTTFHFADANDALALVTEPAPPSTDMQTAGLPAK